MGLLYSSSANYICYTNNYELKGHVKAMSLVDGSALDVLSAARDKIHLGWKLMADPLYGNFKPNQQPYRTLVLRHPEDGAAADMESLSLIENSLAVYGASPVRRLPGDLPADMDADFRYLDFVLMEDTFRVCGLLFSVIERISGEVSL